MICIFDTKLSKLHFKLLWSLSFLGFIHIKGQHFRNFILEYTSRNPTQIDIEIMNSNFAHLEELESKNF